MVFRVEQMGPTPIQKVKWKEDRNYHFKPK